MGREACQKLFVTMISLLVGPSSHEEFQVDISGTTVTVVCPLPEEITWSPKGLEAQGNTYVKENHDSSPLNLSCTSGGKTIQMYLKARGE